MSMSAAGAMLVSGLSASAALLPTLASHRPDLQWRLVTSVEQAALELCAGSLGVAVLDSRHVEQALEMLLLRARRCSPHTQVHVYAAGDTGQPAPASAWAPGGMSRAQ